MAFSLLFFGTHPWHEGGGADGERRGKQEEERDVLWPRVGRRERDAAVAKKRERWRGRTGRGREKEQSDRGSLLPAGLARRRRPCRAAARSVNVFSFFLALSLFPLTLSFTLTHIPVLSTISSRSFSRFLSFPALFHRSPPPAALPCCIAHTRHGCLRNPSVILRTNARSRPGLSRAVRDREKSVRRGRDALSSSSSTSLYRYPRHRWRRRRRGVARRDPTPRITGNIVRPENERERGAFGNVHTYRGLKRSVDKEAFSFGLFPPTAARNSVKVPGSFAAGSGALSTARRR